MSAGGSKFAKLIRSPRYYFEREVASLGPLVRRRTPLRGLTSTLRIHSSAIFDEGRAHLLRKDRLAHFLADLISGIEDSEGWLVPAGGAPISLRSTSARQAFLKLRKCTGFQVWLPELNDGESWRYEILSCAPRFFRNRADGALIRDIPVSSANDIFAEYDARFQTSTMNFREPIDFVLTWVNGRDPEFRKELLRHREASDIDWDRFSESGELRFALRSIHYNAPWYRKIYVVSNCAPPAWFCEESAVHWVRHEELLPEKCLPTFNSHVIESHLFELPGLAEHFVYLNDDMFLSAYAPESRFFFLGRSRSFLEGQGNVDGYRQGSDSEIAPWQSASRRAADLLFETGGLRPGQHHCHTPYSLRASVGLEMRQVFADELTELDTHRFRERDDVPPTSFLYQHFALAKGAAIPENVSHLHVQRRNFRALAGRVNSGKSGAFLCLNDGGDCRDATAFEGFKQTAMNQLFPARAPWEKI